MTIYERAKSDIHLKMTRGDHSVFVFPFVNTDAVPADLSGWTPSAKAIGKSSGNTTDLPVEVVGSSVEMTISHDASTAMDMFSDFDLQFTKAGGEEPITPASGIIQLLSEVTT